MCVSREIGRLGRTVKNKPNQLLSALAGEERQPAPRNCQSVTSLYTLLDYHTAIPYRESTGFLQGIPCVVFPPLGAVHKRRRTFFRVF